MSLDQHLGIVGITPEEANLLDYLLMTESSAYYLNPSTANELVEGSYLQQPHYGVNSYALAGGLNK